MVLLRRYKNMLLQTTPNKLNYNLAKIQYNILASELVWNLSSFIKLYILKKRIQLTLETMLTPHVVDLS